MENQLFKNWGKIISELKLKSGNPAIGWFDVNEKLLSANESMYALLATTEKDKNPENFLVNPDFSKLKQISSNNNLIFDGLITIGNYRDVSFVVEGKVYREKDIFFIFAEADVIGLFEDNKKMSRLNQEVNNLQRELIKEKSKLEKTLEELRETQQMLIHSEKMNALGQMVAGVAHEINNPIAFVTNNLYELNKYNKEIFDALAELEKHFTTAENYKASAFFNEIKNKYEFDYLNEDISDVLKESQNGVERVKKIVEDLRKFSRLDESEIKHIDLIENLQSTFSIIQSEIDKKNIHFSFNSDDKVMSDCFPGQLNQAVLNILMNAIQAVDVNGKITMNVKKIDNEILIRIEDNGCGISPSDKAKIFNPFFTTKPVGSGTGLGLSITYKIITDLHKGKIDVTSEQAKGTIFTLSIPVKIKAE